jgi:hypothetical protein
MILEDILEKVENTNVNNTYLYFVTRILKSGVKKRSKMLDKYDFKIYQIDVAPEIREHLHSLTQEEISKLIAKKMDIHEHEAISADGTEEVYTYSMTNKAMSFADVVDNQLKKKLPKVISLNEIIAEEELWAYCVAFHSGDNDWLYTFKKITAGKVAIDERESNKHTYLKKAMRTLINSKSHKLELIKGENY